MDNRAPKRAKKEEELNMSRPFVLSIALATALAGTAAPALAAGDATHGEKVFRKCMACHSVEEGKNKVGPSLYHVVGRTPGTLDGFNYSKAMEAYGEAGHVWDQETLMTYLEAPRKVVEGTRMAFAGLKKPQDREDLIAYLKKSAEQ